ncbi:hypothetical protein LTR08_008210 [Meristemomyces frigidus]|nr:hypothetical protein LTR08_008210 [Meristemomyces frigidus]
MPMPDAWDSHATQWSGSVRQTTLAPCTTLLRSADALLPFDSPSTRELDYSAGSGQLTRLLKARHPAISILATDISQGELDAPSQRIQDSEWESVQTIVQDAQKLDQLQNDSFSHVLCTFLINFTEDP